MKPCYNSSDCRNKQIEVYHRLLRTCWRSWNVHEPETAARPHPDFPGGSVVKNPPAKEETWVRSLGQEDPLEKEIATDSGTVNWVSKELNMTEWLNNNSTGHILWFKRNWDSLEMTLFLLFTFSVMSNSPWPHGLQHVRLPCPLPSAEACSNSCPLSWWYYPAISSSVIPFSPCLQSFPASWSFLLSWLFTSGGQSIGALASASVLPMNIQDWFPLGWTGWIFLLSKELSGVFSSITVWKHQFFGTQPSLWSNSQHPYMTTGKTIALTIQTFVGEVMSLLFNMLSRLVIAFLPMTLDSALDPDMKDRGGEQGSERRSWERRLAGGPMMGHRALH